MHKLIFLLAIAALLAPPLRGQGGEEDIIWQRETGEIHNILFTKDSKFIVTDEIPANTRIWDVKTGEMEHEIMYNARACFMNNGNLMITQAGDIKNIWSTDTWDLVKTLNFSYWGYDLSISPSSKHLASSAGSEGVVIWDYENDSLFKMITDYPYNNPYGIPRAQSVLFIDDSRLLISDTWTVLYDIEQDIVLKQYSGKMPVLSPDGQYLLTMNWQDIDRDIPFSLNLIDFETGEVVNKWDVGYSRVDYCFSPDNKNVVVSNFGRSIYVWRISDWEEIYQYKNNPICAIPYVSVSPDSQYLAIYTGYLKLLRSPWNSSPVEKMRTDGEKINIYPNPSDKGLNIEFSIKRATEYKISIIRLNGEEIEVLDNSYRDIGKHKITWNTDNIPPGAYFVRLEHKGKSDVKQVLVVK